METRCDRIDQVRRGDNANRYEYGDRETEQCADRPGQKIGGFLVTFAQQAAVGGNKRRGQHTLAEKVLQDVRNTEAGLERIGRLRVAEIVRKNALADESGDTAEQNSGGDQDRKVGTDTHRRVRGLDRLALALRADFENILS